VSTGILQIGNFHINIFGIMIALGVLIGLWFALRQAKEKGLSSDAIYDIVIIAVFAGIVGARVGYILFYNPQYYFANPLDIFKIYEGGMSIHGGLLGGFLAGFLYVKKKGLPFWKMADVLAPSIVLGQAIGRIGCDVFGKAMLNDWWWGVSIKGQLLHPAQVYEFMLDYLLFFFLWRKSKKIEYEGQLITTYLIAYPLIRGVVELFRDNPEVLGLSVAHIISLGFIALVIPIKFILRKNKATKHNSKHSFWRDLGIVVTAMSVSLFIYYGLLY